MKFLCKTSDLLHSLQQVSRAISGQQALPILGNILFKVSGTACTVSATDLELSIITSFDAKIEREGSITIPAKAILNFAQYNSDPEAMIEVIDGNQVRCSSAHGKSVLGGEAANQYPTIPDVEQKTSLSIEATPLLDALNLVTFTSAKTSLRPVLSGVFLRLGSEKMTLVATDSYRLSEYVFSQQSMQELSCIIPVKVLEELKSVLGSKKGAPKDAAEEGGEKKEKSPLMVNVALSQQQIELRVGGTRLLSRLIEGKFPDYHQIIPKTTGTTVTLSAKELATAVKRMHYFSKEVNNNITFTFSGGQAHLTTPQTPIGKDESTITAEVDGADTKIALSSSYLLDFLGHVDSDELKISVMDAMHPAIFRLPLNEKFLHLIMPLRIQES
jgi:DNA polymerase III subunit beta